MEKARIVLRDATEEQKQAIKNNELSINQVFQQLRGKKNTKLSAKEKAFAEGIQYAIVQLNSNVSLKDLYKQVTESLDYSNMLLTVKEFDFSKIIGQSEDRS